MGLFFMSGKESEFLEQVNLEIRNEKLRKKIEKKQCQLEKEKEKNEIKREKNKIKREKKRAKRKKDAFRLMSLLDKCPELVKEDGNQAYIYREKYTGKTVAFVYTTSYEYQIFPGYKMFIKSLPFRDFISSTYEKVVDKIGKITSPKAVPVTGEVLESRSIPVIMPSNVNSFDKKGNDSSVCSSTLDRNDINEVITEALNSVNISEEVKTDTTLENTDSKTSGVGDDKDSDSLSLDNKDINLFADVVFNNKTQNTSVDYNDPDEFVNDIIKGNLNFAPIVSSDKDLVIDVPINDLNSESSTLSGVGINEVIAEALENVDISEEVKTDIALENTDSKTFGVGDNNNSYPFVLVGEPYYNGSAASKEVIMDPSDDVSIKTIDDINDTTPDVVSGEVINEVITKALENVNISEEVNTDNTLENTASTTSVVCDNNNSYPFVLVGDPYYNGSAASKEITIDPSDDVSIKTIDVTTPDVVSGADINAVITKALENVNISEEVNTDNTLENTDSTTSVVCDAVSTKTNVVINDTTAGVVSGDDINKVITDALNSVDISEKVNTDNTLENTDSTTSVVCDAVSTKTIDVTTPDVVSGDDIITVNINFTTSVVGDAVSTKTNAVINDTTSNVVGCADETSIQVKKSTVEEFKKSVRKLNSDKESRTDDENSSIKMLNMYKKMVLNGKSLNSIRLCLKQYAKENNCESLLNEMIAQHILCFQTRKVDAKKHVKTKCR